MVFEVVGKADRPDEARIRLLTGAQVLRPDSTGETAVGEAKKPPVLVPWGGTNVAGDGGSLIAVPARIDESAWVWAFIAPPVADTAKSRFPHDLGLVTPDSGQLFEAGSNQVGGQVGMT
jgi:hypothetical protein